MLLAAARTKLAGAPGGVGLQSLLGNNPVGAVGFLGVLGGPALVGLGSLLTGGAWHGLDDTACAGGLLTGKAVAGLGGFAVGSVAKLACTALGGLGSFAVGSVAKLACFAAGGLGGFAVGSVGALACFASGGLGSFAVGSVAKLVCFASGGLGSFAVGSVGALACSASGGLGSFAMGSVVALACTASGGLGGFAVGSVAALACAASSGLGMCSSGRLLSGVAKSCLGMNPLGFWASWLHAVSGVAGASVSLMDVGPGLVSSCLQGRARGSLLITLSHRFIPSCSSCCSLAILRSASRSSACFARIRSASSCCSFRFSWR